MNPKMTALALALVAAIFAAGRWGFARAAQRPAGDPLGVRLTLEYDGAVPGLFSILEGKSGAHYDLDPRIAARKLKISAKNASVETIQEDAARQCRLKYRPLDRAGRSIKVESR